MKKSGKVLITNATHISLAATRSLGQKGIEVTAVSPDKHSITFYSRYCKHKIVTSFTQEKDIYLDDLVQIVKNEKFDVLLPGGSDLIFTISKYRNKLSPYTKIPIASTDSIEITRDKSKTLKFAMKLGIPCPKTFFFEDIDPSNMKELAREIGFPAVIKPNIGSGARGISYANSLEELENIYVKTVRQYGPSLIQEFIKGKPYSSSALFNSNSQPRRICIQQGLRELPPTGGTQIYCISTRQQEIFDNTLELLKAMKWYGIAGLDFILDERDQKPKFLEINPRFYGSLCLAIAAGVDYPYLLYRLAMDGDIEPDFNYKTGVKCRYLFPKELKYFSYVFRNRAAMSSRNLYPSRVFLDFIRFYEPNLNYFVMSADDPFPAVVNSIRYIRSLIKRNIYKIKNKNLSLIRDEIEEDQ